MGRVLNDGTITNTVNGYFNNVPNSYFTNDTSFNNIGTLVLQGNKTLNRAIFGTGNIIY
jgi:hypothetical protein